jgi:hypothetical protein
MIDLGVADVQIGARDQSRNSEFYSYFRGDREGSAVTRAGQITLDSGLTNSEHLLNYDEETQLPSDHPGRGADDVSQDELAEQQDRVADDHEQDEPSDREPAVSEQKISSQK